MPETTRLPSRRAVARGMAWTMPVIAVAAAAPTASASGEPPSVTNHGLVSTSTQGCDSTTINGTSSSGVTDPGLKWTNVNTVTGPISITFYFNRSGLVFSSRVTGWSALAATGTTLTSGGMIYYAYISTYTGPITVTGRSATVAHSFATTNINCVTPPTTFIARSSSVVNGATVTTNSGVLTIDNKVTGNSVGRAAAAATTAPPTSGRAVY